MAVRQRLLVSANEPLKVHFNNFLEFVAHRRASLSSYPVVGRSKNSLPPLTTKAPSKSDSSQQYTPALSTPVSNYFHSYGGDRGRKRFRPVEVSKARDTTPASRTSSTSSVKNKAAAQAMVRDGNLFNGLNTDFPCLLKNPSKGPEPEYDKVVSGYKTFSYDAPFFMRYNEGVLPELQLAYETWGELNEDGSNAILLAAGLSASSHAKSHADNQKPGWWEKFIGPGCAVDTNKYFVICTNPIGGCYGSSGPSSKNPQTDEPYGTTFPIISVSDMVNAQFLLLDHLGINKLYATVGSSLGGMCSLSAAVQFPDRVGRMISISSCGESHPTSIAVRYLQRKCIMTDPNWNQGHYYGKAYPRNGMKLARELGTMTYRSGPEWDERFARKRINPNEDPVLCPTFLIESYLDYQGEMFCTMYDPNSLLYVSKAMDLFDVSEDYVSMTDALSRVKCPVMVIGVATDILFPIWQQRELAAAFRAAGNERVTYYELDSIYGHDTFLLDLNGVGSAVKGFLETEQTNGGRVRERKDHQTLA